MDSASMADTRQFRSGAIALALVAICAAGGLYYLASKPDLSPTPAAPPAPAPVAAAPAPPPGPPAGPPAGTIPPEFDVVRVDPSGNAVIAGRAEPGATVTIRSGKTVVGTVTADSSGAFALAPDTPLPAGAQQLSLAETLPGNSQVVTGQTSAAVDVPATPATAPLTVLSSPTGSKVESGQGPAAGTLGLGTVDYDADGHAIFSGTAKPGAHVAIALDKSQIGTAIAGPDGHWHLAAQIPHSSGTLSVTDGTSATATAPFALETLPDAIAAGHVIIAPGQNLWLIARHAYGHGNLYTLIYSANAGQIHDPNLIFPGQAFALPKAKS
jgi:nucleoid-associated protein YgaU